jgi:hypothetical protein
VAGLRRPGGLIRPLANLASARMQRFAGWLGFQSVNGWTIGFLTTFRDH